MNKKKKSSHLVPRSSKSLESRERFFSALARLLLSHANSGKNIITSVLPLCRVQFTFVEFIYTALQLLDLLGILRSESALVLNLGRDRRNFLLLALNSLRKLSVDPLQVGNSLLGQLQVSLNLPLRLLHVSFGFLLALESILALIERLLQLSFHLVEVVAPVLRGLDVLLRLLTTLTCTLLLFSKLDDHVLLVGNLVPQGSNLRVLGVLVLLTPSDCCLEIFDLMTQFLSFSCNLNNRFNARP